jgi:hypothetical protein
MYPADLLEHEFFNTYIKTGTSRPLTTFGDVVSFSPSFWTTATFFHALLQRTCLKLVIGDILMISEGHSGSDNMFTLRDGWNPPNAEFYGMTGCEPHG